MIPRAYITEWAAAAPWPLELQVEQDLILSRLIVEISNDEVLGPELAFRGGTCLHKLHLPAPLRYSEDLDYVRRTHSGIKAILNALRSVATNCGLVEHATEQRGEMVHITFDGEATESAALIRIKIETNIAETEAFLPRETRRYRVDSRWWSGEAQVSTFAIEELMATKLRALYQRRKGRDLFDLWHVLEDLQPDDDLIVAGLAHYMKTGIFSCPELMRNLADKLDNAEFIADLDQLVVRRPDAYDPATAADLVMERLGSRLRNAPTIDAIRDGAWRR